jgi:hypothetical protein
MKEHIQNIRYTKVLWTFVYKYREDVQSSLVGTRVGVLNKIIHIIGSYEKP